MVTDTNWGPGYNRAQAVSGRKGIKKPVKDSRYLARRIGNFDD
jgi:hypothetical protein